MPTGFVARAKDRSPRWLKDAANAMTRAHAVRTADQRHLPDFLIIGTKRGGTTSLWNYLIQHPLVPRLFPAWNTKSAHYFEEHWRRGEPWYRSHFPTQRQRETLEKLEELQRSNHGDPREKLFAAGGAAS